MKKKVLIIALWVMPFVVFCQQGFGLDATLASGSGKGEVYPLLLEGRVQWNRFFSSNVGLGLWSSGYSKDWTTVADDESAFTAYHLNDSKALPSLQLSSRLQAEILTIAHKAVSVYVEPGLVFLPFSGRTTHLKEDFFIKDVAQSSAGNTVYRLSHSQEYSLKGDCHPRCYASAQAGVSLRIQPNIDLCLGAGFYSIDFYNDLRGKTLNGHPLDSYLPDAWVVTKSISVRYHFNLD